MFVTMLRVALLAMVAASPMRSRLPEVPASQGPPVSAWWVQVDNAIFHEPAASARRRNISNYYYALGSTDGLSSLLQRRRVGGRGRVHLFYLPEGPSGVTQHTRRSSMSMLQQLRAGTMVSNMFPVYQPEPSYKNPLDASGQKLESELVASISDAAVLQQLTALLQFPTRSTSNTTATHNVVEYLKSTLEALGFATCIQNEPGKPTNVIAFLAGADSQEAGLTLGAHFDSRPFEGAAPGAVDNGSGVAVLLAIATALAQKQVHTRRPVYLVAFGNEEVGCLGSAYFVKALIEGSLPSACSSRGSLVQIQRHSSSSSRATKHQAIIMDEVGWRSTDTANFPKLTVNLESYDYTKETMDQLLQASLLYNKDAVTVIHSNNPFGSDHNSFLDAGLDAVLTIQGDDERYPGYHTSNDTIGYVDSQLMGCIARMNAAGLLRLAGIAT